MISGLLELPSGKTEVPGARWPVSSWWAGVAEHKDGVFLTVSVLSAKHRALLVPKTEVSLVLYSAWDTRGVLVVDGPILEVTFGRSTRASAMTLFVAADAAVLTHLPRSLKEQDWQLTRRITNSGWYAAPGVMRSRG